MAMRSSKTSSKSAPKTASTYEPRIREDYVAPARGAGVYATADHETLFNLAPVGEEGKPMLQVKAMKYNGLMVRCIWLADANHVDEKTGEASVSHAYAVLDLQDNTPLTKIWFNRTSAMQQPLTVVDRTKIDAALNPIPASAWDALPDL